MLIPTVGGALLALAAVSLIVEACLRYCVRHGVNIVLWRGKRPLVKDEQRGIDERIARAEHRELHLFRAARPGAIAVATAGALLIVAGIWVH